MSHIPSIPRWKIILEYFKSAQIPLNRLNEMLYQKGPTMHLYAGGIHPMILTADPEFAQYILLKNRNNYLKTSKVFSTIRHFWGKGLLTSEGDYWQKQRRLLRPGFHRARLMKVFELMEKVTDEYLEEMDKALKQDSETDICENMQELTFRIIANAIFSSNLQRSEYDRINQLMPRLQSFIMRMFRQPYLNWWLKMSGQVKKYEKLSQEERDIVHSYIRERRSQKGDYHDLLQMLMEVRYEDTGEGMTDTQLIDEVNILFIAGHDTSAKGLSWAWYLLAQHPNILNKMLEEINQVIPGEAITFDQLMKLEYTQQVLEETMRLYPPVWATNRVAVEDDEFKGIKIKKGTTCATYIYGLHRSPELWENPECFQPDRFAKDRKKDRHTFAFIPFGGGPRFCIGRQFALMEMKLVLAKMVKRYHMDLVPGQQIELAPAVNLQPRYGIRMNVSKREENLQPTAGIQQAPGTKPSVIPQGCPFASLHPGLSDAPHP